MTALLDLPAAPVIRCKFPGCNRPLTNGTSRDHGYGSDHDPNDRRKPRVRGPAGQQTGPSLLDQLKETEVPDQPEPRRATEAEIAAAHAFIASQFDEDPPDPDSYDEETQGAYEYALEAIIFANGGRYGAPPDEPAGWLVLDDREIRDCEITASVWSPDEGIRMPLAEAAAANRQALDDGTDAVYHVYALMRVTDGVVE